MKKIIIALLAVMLATPAWAEKPADATASAWLKDMIGKVAKLTAKEVSDNGRETPVAVAGLRGSEQSAEQLEPYWKGDLTVRSADYQAYRDIEQAMQQGRYADALKLISDFNRVYGKSKLMPEVQFTTGLAYTGVGEHKKAVEAFEQMLKLYPKHELAGPSRDGIARLKKA